MFNRFNKTPLITLKDIATDVMSSGVGFVDVRTKEEYATGHAKGAVNIPLDVIPANTELLKRYERVYVICQSGGRSALAVQILRSHGVNAINISGGTTAWRSAGLPTAGQ